MTASPFQLVAEDAVELGAMLGFIAGWLAAERVGLEDSLRRFVGTATYGVEELRNDVVRFEFQLGGGDGTAFLGNDQP